MAVQCITFHADNTFEEQFHGCIGSPSNYGTYEIKGNTLKLYFDDKDTSKNGYSEESFVASFSETDSIDIIAQIINAKSHEGVPFASVFLISKNRTIYVADIDGSIRMRVLKQKKPLNFEISCVGYLSFKISLTPANSKKLKIYLTPHELTVPNGSVWKFKITKDNNNRVILKSQESSYVLSKME